MTSRHSADVIVVGAGSSGSAVVRRLVDAGLRVTVIEAGPPDDLEALHDPAGNIVGLPGPSVTTREQLRDYGRSWVGSPAHPVGTAKMGVENGAVVDPELRVNGVQGLRVADLSVAPTLTTGNTNGPALMIGERAADFILGQSAA